ncbi:PilZ domain-containing protein [Aestuariivirga sp.]|uniref:PilZ domain-containing protein n=1 Tax=Aestuariivirga sp. TaxID=2650926 RepID=UPI0039E4EF42
MEQPNKRGAPRQRVLKEGKIVTMDKWSVFDCTIRDISELGARLRCADPASVPTDFRLLIRSTNSIQPAHVVWRREDQLGVMFTGPAKTAPPRKF